ncbi:MAG: radical SAM protein [Desulfovibrio sp.]|nr:radical SAM protein [Desulfovibrio sp.]
MRGKQLTIHMLMADRDGNIYDAPDLLMLCRRGGQWGLPRPDEVFPLPKESELFLLPGRHAAGLNPESGQTETVDGLAVAAFAAPAHTLSAHPVYITDKDAPLLPLFAYAAVGFAEGRFYACLRKVDADTRQQFSNIPHERIAREARRLLRDYPKNRLVRHILDNCVAKYDCPAARNFALGRHEAPLPTSRTCNARCVGCISSQEADSPVVVTPQCRLEFVPTPEEICEVMQIHAARETDHPVFSFGQGCEGDPLMNASLLEESVRLYRRGGGLGTVNCNTNASRPDAVAALSKSGLTSIRVSMNSARPELYVRYYRPQGYTFEDVKTSIKTARSEGIFVSLNLLYFPGITDTEEELEALARLIGECGVSMIQWRNLNIDPEWYYRLMTETTAGEAPAAVPPSIGLRAFMKRLKKLCPWLRYGYFNPFLGEKADLSAPLPGMWQMPDPTVTDKTSKGHLTGESHEEDIPPEEGPFAE